MRAFGKAKNLTKQRGKVKANHPWRTARFGKNSPDFDLDQLEEMKARELLPTDEELEVLPLSTDQQVLDQYATDNHEVGQEDWRDFSELED